MKMELLKGQYKKLIYHKTDSERRCIWVPYTTGKRAGKNTKGKKYDEVDNGGGK